MAEIIKSGLSESQQELGRQLEQMTRPSAEVVRAIRRRVMEKIQNNSTGKKRRENG